jgi:hypothetical protein
LGTVEGNSILAALAVWARKTLKLSAIATIDAVVTSRD